MDAAVAAALAMTVADPANTSLGGRCHIVILSPDGQVNVIDGRSALPQAWSPQSAEIGAKTVPVPGIPRAFEKAVAEHGRLDLNKVDLAVLIERWFTDRLMRHRGVSSNTIASYRDTFRLLFAFAQCQAK